MKPTDKMLEHVRVTISELENELLERAIEIKSLRIKLESIRKMAYRTAALKPAYDKSCEGLPQPAPDDLVRHCLELSW